jgi:hypothetical protein
MEKEKLNEFLRERERAQKELETKGAELIHSLERQIQEQMPHCEPDACSWGMQEGVILSINQAYFCLEILKSILGNKSVTFKRY